MAEISLRDGIAFVTLPLSELTELLAVAPAVPPPPGVYKPGGRYRTVPANPLDSPWPLSNITDDEQPHGESPF